MWKEIAGELARRLATVRDLVLDTGYFAAPIRIPGQERSTNPYDAPVGALGANFNTVSFRRDPGGRLVSAEPQTPLIPFAQRKISALREREGRFTFTHEHGEAARYAGELLLHSLRERGVVMTGSVRIEPLPARARLIYRHLSAFDLGEVLRRMFEFSNNYIANQILIAAGAQAYPPPETCGRAFRR